VRRLRRYLVTGLAVLLPTALTVYVLWFLFIKLDSLLGNYIKKVAHVSLPGVGFAAEVIIVLVVGAMATNFLGRRMIKYSQRLFENIPLFNKMYVAVREISDAFLGDRSTVFRHVALVEFPRAGMYAVGFITAEDLPGIDARIGRKSVNVFVPTSPNPTTGFALVVPEEDVVRLPISVEDGLKIVISGGSVVPESIRSLEKGPGKR
jgi:uncharacterized membrane protein